jgi:hypothetical protein
LPDLRSGGGRFGAVFFPVIRQPQEFAFGHLNQRKHLAAVSDVQLVQGPRNPKRAPETDAFHAIEPSVDHQSITERGWAAVINFGPDYDRVALISRHFDQAKPKLLGQQSPRDLNEAEVSDIVDYATTIGIEEHHLRFGLNTRPA